MDQTRFKTLQAGIEVARELTLGAEQRQAKGESFTLTLMVNIPFQDNAEKPLDIIVDRIQPDVAGFKLANDDRIVTATGRLEPTGETFKISVMFQMGRTHNKGACVFVSQDMERIILDRFRKEMDGVLENGSMS